MYDGQICLGLDTNKQRYSFEKRCVREIAKNLYKLGDYYRFDICYTSYDACDQKGIRK